MALVKVGGVYRNFKLAHRPAIFQIEIGQLAQGDSFGVGARFGAGFGIAEEDSRLKRQDGSGSHLANSSSSNALARSRNNDSAPSANAYRPYTLGARPWGLV